MKPLKEVHEELRKSPLAHPTRLALMVLLVARHSVEFNQAVSELGVTPGALWTHVKLLEKHGYLKLGYWLTPHGPRLILTVTEQDISKTLRILNVLRTLSEFAEGAEHEGNASCENLCSERCARRDCASTQG